MFVGFVGHRAVEPGLVPTRCRPADRDCLACRRLLSPPHPGSKFTHVKSPRPTQFRRTRDLSAGRHRLQLAKLQPGDQQGAVATTAFHLVLDRHLTRSGHSYGIPISCLSLSSRFIRSHIGLACSSISIPAPRRWSGVHLRLPHSQSSPFSRSIGFTRTSTTSAPGNTRFASPIVSR